jgi:protein ImuB
MSAASLETSSAPLPQRRVLALVLPELPCELAEARLLWGLQRDGSKRSRPLGVVLASGAEPKKHVSAVASEAAAEPKQLDPTAKLSAVNASARRYGVREGQSIAEACALIANLVVREVTEAEVRETLGRIAEVGLSLGATVSVAAPDTVCLDISGSAHLQGGEVALACEFANRVRGMGHSVRIAISEGPRLARAFATWFTPDTADPEDRGVCVVPSNRTVSALSTLPLMALPISAETAGWFMRLGVLTVGELGALPKQALGSRLGEAMASVSELCAGRDSAPLVAYTPERTVIESSAWDEPVTGSEPLLFVLGGLVSRVSARLTGRGEAAHSLVLTILYDPAIARFRAEKPEHTLRFKLAAPLHRADEIRRILSARVSRLKLAAPSLGLRLEVPKLLPAVSRQLELSQVLAGVTVGTAADDEIPVLIAELASEIGDEKVGTLKLVDSHRPEAKSKLSQAALEAATSRSLHSPRLRKTEPSFAELPGAPTRLLIEPCELHAPLRVGVSLAIDRSLYTIEHLRFEQRLEAVEWWGRAPVTRDYVRLWLQGISGGFEALAYVDRNTGRRYLQAVAD